LLGLGIGILAGVALSFAETVDPNDCGSDSSNFCSRGAAIATGAFVMGAIGAGAGALIQSGPRWMPLQITRSESRDRSRSLTAKLTLRF
jgi:hypothetical protein